MDNFSKYGNTFQIKLLTALLADKQFLQQTIDHLIPSYFGSDGKKWLINIIKEYFAQYKQPPTIDVLKAKTVDITIDLLKAVVEDDIRELIINNKPTDMDYVKDETIGFIQSQAWKNALLESATFVQKGDFDKARVIIENADRVGVDNDLGMIWNDNVEDRYIKDTRECIPFPWDVMNEITRGGSGKGDLIVFVAPPGVGKTTCLINAGAHAVKLGKRVNHYTLELNDVYTSQKYDAWHTGIPIPELEYHVQDIKDAINALKGEMVVKYYPTKSATINTIVNHIEKCIMMGKKPDMMIIDYADLLRDAVPTKYVRHDLILGNVYEDLRRIAGQYNIPVLTASQSNRSSAEQDIVAGDKIADSYAKLMVADVVLSLSRKVTDKISGTGRVHMIKNRFGPDGLTFPSKISMMTSRISVYAETSVQGKEVRQTMQTKEVVIKQLLKQKFNELKEVKKNDTV